MEGAVWNPWHGCKKVSAGCLNCYMMLQDASYGIDSSVIRKNKAFDAPLKKDRKGNWKMQGPLVFVCLTSDLFLEETDGWRSEVWDMIKIRSDLHFVLITKRVERILDNLPLDWGQGYSNVGITVTMENQETADTRLPILSQVPAVEKSILCAPLLSGIKFDPELLKGMTSVHVGGENGPGSRVMNWDWVRGIHGQCQEAGVKFVFDNVGEVFQKEGKIYNVPRNLRAVQAKKAEVALNKAWRDELC